MRWTGVLGSVVVLVVGLSSAVQAQAWHSPNWADPYDPGNVAAHPLPIPGPAIGLPPKPPWGGPVLPGLPAPGSFGPPIATTPPRIGNVPRLGAGNSWPGETPRSNAPGTAPGAANTFPGTGAGANSAAMSGSNAGAGNAPGLSGGEGVGGSAPAGGGSSVASAAPNMIGDIGYGAAALLAGVPSSFRVPLFNRGAFKIADNESPRPQDRLFFTANYFGESHVLRGGPAFNVFRQTVGFEKTFPGGNFSFGARLPALESNQIGDVGIDGFGDLTLIFKYALVNDPSSGSVLSGGLALTVPTGRDVVLGSPATSQIAPVRRALIVPTNGDTVAGLGSHLNSVLFQPWAGFLWDLGRLYAHGFTSFVIPTEPADVTFFAADLGVGYRLFQNCAGDRVLTQVIPTFEVHANVPLSHAGSDSSSLVVLQDQVVLTSGVHLGLWDCSYLTLALATPVSGPLPYDWEALVQINVRF